MSDELGPVLEYRNLTEIIGRGDADGVVEFALNGALLNVSEACDRYFNADLTIAEVDSLIGYLQEQRAIMVERSAGS